MQLETLQKLIEPQLITAPPSDGDYLDGVTPEEFISVRLEDSPLTYEQKKAFVERKIQEWKEHIGQRMFFYMVYEGASLKVYSAWESDLPKLAEEYELRDKQPTSTTMPLLVKSA